MISIDSPEFRDLRATAIYEREKEEFEEKKKNLIENGKNIKGKK